MIQKPNLKALLRKDSVQAVRRTKRALFAAVTLHTFAPLVLLVCLAIPFILASH